MRFAKLFEMAWCLRGSLKVDLGIKLLFTLTTDMSRQRRILIGKLAWNCILCYEAAAKITKGEYSHVMSRHAKLHLTSTSTSIGHVSLRPCLTADIEASLSDSQPIPPVPILCNIAPSLCPFCVTNQRFDHQPIPFMPLLCNIAPILCPFCVTNCSGIRPNFLPVVDRTLNYPAKLERSRQREGETVSCGGSKWKKLFSRAWSSPSAPPPKLISRLQACGVFELQAGGWGRRVSTGANNDHYLFRLTINQRNYKKVSSTFPADIRRSFPHI